MPTPKNPILEQLGLLTQEIVSLCRTRRTDESLELSSVRIQRATKLEAALRRTADSARTEVKPGSNQHADVLDNESSAFESLSSLYGEDAQQREKLAGDARKAFDQSLQIRMRSLGGRLGQAAMDELK